MGGAADLARIPAEATTTRSSGRWTVEGGPARTARLVTRLQNARRDGTHHPVAVSRAECGPEEMRETGASRVSFSRGQRVIFPYCFSGTKKEG
jgi:hypothetical protein